MSFWFLFLGKFSFFSDLLFESDDLKSSLVVLAPLSTYLMNDSNNYHYQFTEFSLNYRFPSLMLMKKLISPYTLVQVYHWWFCYPLAGNCRHKSYSFHKFLRQIHNQSRIHKLHYGKSLCNWQVLDFLSKTFCCFISSKAYRICVFIYHCRKMTDWSIRSIQPSWDTLWVIHTPVDKWIYAFLDIWL